MIKKCSLCKYCMPLFLTAILILSAYENNAYATPVITNISVQEQAIALGAVNTVHISCADNSPDISNITGVYADINTSAGMFLNNTFAQNAGGSGENYRFLITTKTPSKFHAAGFFNVFGYCVNSLGEIANSNISFFVINKTLIRGKELDISIDPFDSGRIGYFDYPGEITQYSRMNITVEFINTGSTTYTKKTELNIYGIANGTFSIIANRTGGTSNLNPGGRNVEMLRYTPLYQGYYWIRIIIHYAENKTASVWGTFYVKPYYDIGSGSGTPAPPSNAGGGTVHETITTIQLPNPTPEVTVLPVQEIDHGIKKMNISYPQNVTLAPGESSVIYVVVSNEGTAPLRELMILSRINGDISIDVQPKIVQTLYGGRSAVLMITLDSNPGIQEGAYFLDFTVHTDKISENGRVNVIVDTAALDENLYGTILNYQYILSKLEEEMEGLKIDGINTAKILPHITEAKSKLNLAKDAYGVKDYEKARDNLKKTRNALIDAVIEMALARSDMARLIVLAPSVWLLIMLLIIIIIAAIALYLHKRDAERWAKKKEKESLEGQT